MVSIVLNSYNPTLAHLHTTMACLAAIRKFTDPPYEIIVVDNTPELPIRDDYKVLQPYTLIQNNENQTVYTSYNQGAEAAQYDNLVFIQSDVFCHERTINKLVKYLEEYDMAFPQQVPISREDVKQIYEVEDGGQTHVGGRDAGMLAITKEAFNKVGGWDVTEESKMEPLSPYAISKLAMDHLGQLYAKSYGMHIVVTRAFNHTGAGRGEMYAESAFAKQVAEIENGKRDVLETLIGLSSASVACQENTALRRPVDFNFKKPSCEKFKQLTGWEPAIPLEETLTSILEYWRDK